MMKRLLAGVLLSGLMLGSQAAGIDAADLKWDLSYQAALSEHPIGEHEFMSFWPARYPQRPIHDRLAKYRGEPVEASLLIEMPDGHTGDPSATWVIKTHRTAQLCNFHPKALAAPCKQLDPARTEAIMREVMRLKPLASQDSDQNQIGKGEDGVPILMNYMGFLSVYVDGRALQRPIVLSEWQGIGNPGQLASADAGRLSAVLKRLDPPPGPTEVAASKAAATEARAESSLRSTLAQEVSDALKRDDYKALDAIYARLAKSGLRTRSGVWQLAIFYKQLRQYPQRSRDDAYWSGVMDKAKAWQRQNANSVPALVFESYMHSQRMWAFRGQGWGNQIKEADLAEFGASQQQGHRILGRAEIVDIEQQPKNKRTKRLRAADAEVYRALIENDSVTSWGSGRAYESLLRTIGDAPIYHEMYFSAAWFMQEMWGGGPDGIDLVARAAASVDKTAEAQAMYARVYWEMNNRLYHGTLFEKSLVDWDVMKRSFDALVQAYPDPWNLNAYAYFACLAKDYRAAAGLFKRIGEREVSDVWDRGDTSFSNCRSHLDDDMGHYAAEQQASLAARRQLFIDKDMAYAQRKLKAGETKEALRIAMAAQELDRQNGMQHTANGEAFGRLFHELKRFDDAVKAYARAITAEPTAALYWRRGLAQVGAGHADAARADFEQAASRMTPFVRTGNAAADETNRSERGQMRDTFDQYGISNPSL